jgi:hypothetical protein
MRQTTAGRPCTLDEVAAALEAASYVEIERGAGTLDEARRSLRAIAVRFERALSRLEDCWQGEGARAGWPGGDVTMSRLGEPLRRTRELLQHLDESECGHHLRRTANTLAAGQARVRELKAQREADPAANAEYDERGRYVLHDIALAYQDIGRGLGGTAPPPLVLPDEPAIGADLRSRALDEDDTVFLASGSDTGVELFRPVGPVHVAGLPGDPVLPPPSGGGGGGGGGMPMMPMPMGGMGGMGAMGGMGGLGGHQQDNAAQQRKAANALQGDQGAWGRQDEGWEVLGRKQQIADAQEKVRQGLDREFGKFLKGDRDG